MIQLLFPILSVIGLLFSNGILERHYETSGQNQEVTVNEETQTPHIVHVHLKKVYLDGISIKEIIEEHPLSMEDFWATYKDWRLVKQSAGQIYFEKKIDDISPIAKTKGIFGLTDETTLTIFKGNPSGHQIIHTFFQIDTKALEADDAKRLLEGIPVRNKEHFERVLRTLAKYEENKG